jgi:ferredoxin
VPVSRLANWPIDLYWFSGTGNTLLVARELAAALRAGGAAVALRRLEAADPTQVNPAHALGLAFPVAVQTTYPLVWRFCRALPTTASAPAFMVDTLGGYSGAIVGPLRAVLRRQGYAPVGAREIQMPINCFRRKDAAPRDERVRTRGLAQARAYAEDLLAGKTHWGHIPLLPDLFYALVGSALMWRWVAHDGGRIKLDAGRCTGCGLCQQLCPVNNIRLMADLPVRADRCEFCLRCIAFCPTRALDPPYMSPAQYRAVAAAELLRDEQAPAQLL